MSSKATYFVIAVLGIAAASAAAWWYQQPRAGSGVVGAATATDTSPAMNAKTRPASAPSGASGNPTGNLSGNPAGNAKPPSVEVAKVDVAKLIDETQSVGTLRSRRGVMVRPEVAGRITQLNFTDGQRVKAGQVLVQFDDQLQQAQVQQTLAEVSIAQANQKRNQELVAQGFISQRSLDESAANLQVAQAKLLLARATAARLKIIAPFNGVAGIRQVNVGDYLKDGADIVNIEDMDAIFVDFRLPERFQAKVKRGQTAQIELDAMPGRKFSAQVQAIDPLIDANGRSVGVRGCIDNRGGQLRPGMFARVNPVFGVRDSARVVPEEAIVPQGGRQYVIRLNKSADGKTFATQRVEIKVGLRSPGKVEITDGLEAGELVVIAGQQRIQKDGTAVTVIDTSTSTTSARPARPAAESAAPAAPAAAAVSPALAASGGISGNTAANGSVSAKANAKANATAIAEAIAKPAAKPITEQGPNPCDSPAPGAKSSPRKPAK